MAKLSIKVGATSVSLGVFVQDSSSTTGAGLTGLAYNTASLTCYAVVPGASAAAITLATLAAANSAWSSGGFKEIDATNMPGWYRFDIPNTNISTGRSVGVHFKGATNMAPLPLEIELTGWDNQDAVHGGLSSLPNTAVTGNASLLTSGTGTDQLSVASGRVDAGKILGTAISTPATAGILDVNVKNMNNVAATSITTIKAVQGLATDGVVPTVTTVTNQLTAAAIATGVWTDTTGTDFTTALSVGKSVMNGVTLGTGLTINAYTGNTAQTGDSFARIGAAGAGLTAITGVSLAAGQKVDVDTIKTNPVVNAGTITFPTTATLASTTNITAGTIATVTNLTNAPTNGDLTATMKTSVTTAATAATPTAAAVTGAVGSVTGAVGSVTGAVGSVTGAVGSVTAAVTLTAGERNSVADALLDRDMSTGADSGSTTVRTVRQALRFLRNKWSIAGGTLTVTKEDDTTSSWTAAITTTAGNPVSTVDPAGP